MTGTTRYVSADAARDNVVAIARSQLGTTESGDNHTKYGVWYGWDNVAWCNIFVSWVFAQAGLLGQPFTPKSAYCPGTIATYRQWGQAHTNPAVGDVMILDNGGHVGIVESVVSASEVVFISGNTIDPAHPTRAGYTEAQGWGVYRRVHYLQPGDVFGRPAWGSAVATVHPVPVKPAATTAAADLPLFPLSDFQTPLQHAAAGHPQGPYGHATLFHRALRNAGIGNNLTDHFTVASVALYAEWQRGLGMTGPAANGIPGPTSMNRLVAATRLWRQT